MPMPLGRPESSQHGRSYIAVGLAQGFSLTLFLFLLLLLGV